MKDAQITKLEKPFEIKPYSHSELCALYGISKYIFTKWIKEINNELGKRKGWYYNTQQVKIIIEKYGVPGLTVNDAA